MAEDTDQHRDKRARLDPGGNEEADPTEVEPLTQATNHDRQGAMETDSAMDVDHAESAGSMQKDSKDGGATDNSRFVEDEMTLEQLQKDMGEAFLLCRSTVERQRPNPQQHLLALYGLGPVLRSVARTDPKTGEKINKLRKSYEGQIKGFGLAGRNKPVKGERNVEEDEPGPLRRMAGSSAWGLEPDEQWNAEHARSKIEVTPDFKAKLKQAMQMQPGTVRNNAHWEDVLGFDKPKPQPYGISAQQAGAVQPVMSRLPNGAAVRPLPPPPPPAVIQAGAGTGSGPKRQTRGKKRSYGDDSFVGYGEGFSDADDGDDGDDYGSQRKRKKVTLMAS
ncbi:hypothetical protein A1O3_08127 [Capronia epimyces CBS 606.96]|uniref:Mediator of RNA polymerase II transcription subunit 19 n=1 Tax=Capronia epimyces CBS 606.96 TaxID=1182542 RepID=W9XH80_9EURO|nr:uncharacterized protein A1O3_08127 [Capronia epimyces CBS 606.96]EXJ79842.1 hypothetical protein A1O3_08127 [Capronia epimyces CBS 606.96]